jgi:hypothetical protein
LPELGETKTFQTHYRKHQGNYLPAIFRLVLQQGACIIETSLRQVSQKLRKALPLNDSLQTPFDSVENAHQYVRLLAEAIAEAKGEIATDLDVASRSKLERRVQALQIVQFKLDKLEQHLQTSSRLLNDLRTLRRLLLEERVEPVPAGKHSAA